MFLRFFKQTLPQVIVAIIILSILLWLRSFISIQVYDFYFDSIKMPFFEFVSKWFPEGFLQSRIVAYFVMLITAFFLLQINSKHIIIKQRTYLPALIFVLIATCFLPLQRINPATFSAFIIVFALDHIFSIYHKENVLDNLFKAGFYIAIASLFYAPSIFYILAVFLSILSIRTFNFREWFAPLFGLITPWFFFFFYHYFINSDLTIAYRVLVYNLFTEINMNYSDTMLYIFCGYCLLLILITGVFLLNSLQTQKISVRKYHGVLFWFSLVTFAIFLFIPTCSIEILYIASIPIAFQFSHYFSMTTKRFWPSLLFSLVLLMAILMQFYSYNS